MTRPILFSVTLLLVFAMHSNGQQTPGTTSPGEGDRTIVITPAAPATVGSPDYFRGSVRVTRLFQPTAPSRTSGASVTFEPGARSAWHFHPLGQTLIVTAGTGWIQQAGGQKREIRAGDVIWTPPRVEHWHGATATSAMTHIAIQEYLDGKNVEWLEQVSDQQYISAVGQPR